MKSERSSLRSKLAQVEVMLRQLAREYRQAIQRRRDYGLKLQAEEECQWMEKVAKELRLTDILLPNGNLASGANSRS